MSRACSKNKRRPTSSIQKTQKKKIVNREVLTITKSAVWLGYRNTRHLVYDKREELLTGEKYQNKQKVAQQVKFLKIENPVNLKINRARILDWLLDVCRSFRLRWESYWCAIQILDYLINTIACVSITNIHITAVTSLFMACKIHQISLPSIHELIQKAVYKAFTAEQVVLKEAQILMICSNSKVKPKYMNTIYNYLYQQYPELSFQASVQILRKLVIFWMDPVMSVKNQSRPAQIKLKETSYLSYQDIVNLVTKKCDYEQIRLNLQQVGKYYASQFDCQNIVPEWNGLKRLKL